MFPGHPYIPVWATLLRAHKSYTYMYFGELCHLISDDINNSIYITHVHVNLKVIHVVTLATLVTKR